MNGNLLMAAMLKRISIVQAQRTRAMTVNVYGNKDEEGGSSCDTEKTEFVEGSRRYGLRYV